MAKMRLGCALIVPGLLLGCTRQISRTDSLWGEVGWVRMGMTAKELLSIKPQIIIPSKPETELNPDITLANLTGIYELPLDGLFFSDATCMFDAGTLFSISFVGRTSKGIQVDSQRTNLAREAFRIWGSEPSRHIARQRAKIMGQFKDIPFPMLLWDRNDLKIQLTLTPNSYTKLNYVEEAIYVLTLSRRGSKEGPYIDAMAISQEERDRLFESIGL